MGSLLGNSHGIISANDLGLARLMINPSLQQVKTWVGPASEPLSSLAVQFCIDTDIFEVGASVAVPPIQFVVDLRQEILGQEVLGEFLTQLLDHLLADSCWQLGGDLVMRAVAERCSVEPDPDLGDFRRPVMNWREVHLDDGTVQIGSTQHTRPRRPRA